MDQPSAETDAVDLAVAWRGVLADLQPHQRAWMRASEPVTLHGNTAIVAVPNDFTRSQLEGRLRAQLEDALSQIFRSEIRIAVTVNPDLDTEQDAAPDVLAAVEEADAPTSMEPLHPQIDMSTYHSEPAEQIGRAHV